MNIPPFPSQDLAKLVLGYLAEEQLMTAYDEFLSASPYLDALRNEYDRIFMTSLKNILAEYRAVKIFVETCKPYALRRRLFGCTNLLEIVKFLVQNVDVSKLHVPEGNRSSSDAHNMCAVCHSLKLPSCVCKSHSSVPIATSQSDIEDNSHETSVEATPLEDLPGNHVTTKRKVKTLRKQQSKSSQSGSDSNVDVENDFSSNFEHTLPNNSQNQQSRPQATCIGVNNNNVLARPNTVQSVDQINAYSSNTTSTTVYQRSNVSCTSNVIAHRVSTAGTFQDFTSGVQGTENIISNVPDSSTSENVNAQSNACKEKFIVPVPNTNVKPTSKAHIFLTVGTIKTSIPSAAIEGPGSKSISTNSKLPSKPNESKVTILSDIKVDKTFNNDKMPAILKNATSSPLMHMQTILINGSPVYKQPPQAMMRHSCNFTKDEIMAMPTIIVVPTSGAPQVSANNQIAKPPQPVNPPLSTVSSTAQSLEPLVIDVPSSSPTLTNNTLVPNNSNMPLLDQPKGEVTEMLVKTVSAKMVSAPRAGAGGVSPGARGTPQGPPPARKASSTPRRTSHVRVLDFATPRRILEETIRENAAEEDNAPVEVVISRSPNLHTLANPNNVDTTVDKISKDSTVNSSGSSKENDKSGKNIPAKKHNWDADLRAVAIVNNKEDIPKSNIQPRCRPKPKTKKTKSSLADKKNKEKGAHKNACKCAENDVKKAKNTNKKRKSIEVAEDPVIIVDDNSNVPIKPTINIITGQDWSIQENDKNQNNKVNNSDPSDTPEMDRLSLQNVIGAKLNISDLLGTPYKQVLYDMQMETPKFLGPDLPDVPMSDIKIMNIPTPRFLDTPKPLQATPSSYSSRQTDYSSGGSYYKPDDQDYLPLGDLGYPVSKTTEKEVSAGVNANKTEKEENSKPKSGSSRPVRKCAKNVSYYNSPIINKHREISDKSDKTSVCSDTLSINSLNESKNENASGSKSVKESKPKTKRNSTSKKHKTPVKRETPKSFMKIKPRRVTPTKESVKGKVRVKKSPRKRTTSKEKTSATPIIVSIPTKSRRKSSTPRKLHCTKNYNTESSGHDSPEIASKAKEDVDKEARLISVPDSDNEQVPLHWSDDGSQDAKPNEQETNIPTNETEDIMKIKEYIASECVDVAIKSNNQCSNLHANLIKRGFDAETAKIIERDLLDSADAKETNLTKLPPVATQTNKDEADLEKTLESDTSSVLKIAQEEEDCEEIELGESECYEDSDNFITCNHEDLKNIPRAPATKLKDKFSMEVCIDDEVTVRLRATPATTLLDQDPDEFAEYNEKETEMAVSSIENIDKLYTPMKDSDIRAQVYDIFESTLTSLDTPLKAYSPKIKEVEAPVPEIILEVEKMEDKEKPDDKKRKRLHSVESTDSATSSKRTKPDPHYLLHSTNIQNIDIESVLSKLHGP